MEQNKSDGACTPSFSSAELERTAFERWYSNDGQWSSGIERNGDGYKYQGADNAWRVWQAAVAFERDWCAKLVSDIGDDWEQAGDMRKVAACDYLEDAIRLRSNGGNDGRQTN